MSQKGGKVKFQSNSSSTTQLSIADSAQAMEALETQRSSTMFSRVYNELSSSRQIFCLLCVFDFLFTFLLWIIYAQGVAVTGLDDSLSSEIEHYGVSSSLFDIMILSLLRVFILLLVYGYHKNMRILTVAFTTFVSTVYLIVKAFVFEFESDDKDSGSRPVDYFLHIGSFMLCWGEAWYMQVKVLPKERRAAAAIIHDSKNYGSIKPPLSSGYTVLSFHTPPEPDSGDEEAEVISRANLEYMETARKATSKSLSFLYAEKHWSIEKQKDGMLIESTTDEKLGKLIRLRVCIDASPFIVHPLVFGDPQNILKWNTSIIHIECIQKLNSSINIMYSSMGEVAGGFISARDFVSICQYQRMGEMYISTSTSVGSPLKPPVEGVVRGETILNCYALFPAENERDKSEFVWILTTTLKPGSIPQMIVDRSIPGFLMDCVTKLKKECEELKNNANSPL